jgi:fucose 4-O-acetylase-like acetyltransferase
MPALALTPVTNIPVTATAITARPARMVYLDNLRVLLAILVVLHHAGQPYGPTGGRWPVFDAERAFILGPFFGVNAAFFMGLFFFIAGSLTPGAVERKGSARFLADRAVRLGVPLLAFGLAVFPMVTYLTERPAASFGEFYRAYLADPEIGHLWFLTHLLVYSLAYAAWQRFGRLVPGGALRPAPGHQAILLYALALGAVTFAVRLAFPVDHWIDLAGVIPIEVAHLPQYLSLFILGIIAARHDWLRRLPAGVGMTWLGIGLAAALARYLNTIAAQAGVALPLAPGGPNEGALLWSVWEAFICVGLSVGLLTLFRERVDGQGRLARALAANTYGVYVLHLLPIVGLQMAIAGAPLPPLAKFGLVGAVGVPLCFLISAGLRRLPGVGRVL